MTNHRATPEQWAQIETWVKIESEYSTCLIELRARVEALEAAQRPLLSKPLQLTPEQEEEIAALLRPNYPAPLVERVAAAICASADCGDEPVNWMPEAHAAVREIKAWLQEKGYTALHTGLLEQEAGDA